jgi:hypothetical protein
MSAPTFTPPPLPSARRHRVATIAYLVIAVLVGMAVMREFHRVQRKKATFAVPTRTAGEAYV